MAENSHTKDDLAAETDSAVKLWNRDFFLLWQGQFVSAAGDIAYQIALGFWVLAVTGSTAIMGTLMAASMAPRIVISPFAGVIVDRADRKKILILMDLLRGIAVGLIAVAAYTDMLEVWMVFVGGVIIGMCGAFFNPAVSSVIPDIVHRSKIVQANSVFGMVHSVSSIISHSAAGFLYAMFGAPLLFLSNSLSYLFSSGTELFLRVPRVERDSKASRFIDDLKGGLKFVWEFTALKHLMYLAAALNFFISIAFVLLLPLFEQNEHLGPEGYGIVVAIFTAGMFISLIFTSTRDIPPRKRSRIFIPSLFVFAVSFAAIPLHLSVLYIGVLMFVCGIANTFINVFIMATMQIVIPQEMRGRVFALLGSLIPAFMPIAYVTGGILAEFIQIRVLFSSCFVVVILLFLGMALSRRIRDFVNFDPDKDTLLDLK